MTAVYCMWPQALGNSYARPSRVPRLNPRDNNLSGEIPSRLGGLANLQQLWLIANLSG